MDSIFFDIALPRIGRLTSVGASVTTELACKCDIVSIRKGNKRIEIAYEPYGPSFCDVKSDGGDRRRIEVDVAFPSVARMVRGDKTAAALAALQSDFRAYIDALYTVLEDELK